MYLKIRVGEGWKVFGEIRNIEYFVANWDWEHYRDWVGSVNYQVGPVDNEEEWKGICSDKGTRSFVYATLILENGDCRLCAWDYVGYLLNEEGKTIEVISTSASR